MSGDFFRQRDTAQLVGGSNHQIPVEAHEGHYKQYLRRFERLARKSVAQGIKGIAEIGPRLMKLIADPRNIKVAMDQIIANGGMPGPDGLDCGKLSSSESWELARTLSKCNLDGSYKHGRTWPIRIKKQSGRGYRTIHVENQIDRIVARAILQIVQPLMDSRFNKLSFGFRPGIDRRHALKAALDCLENNQQHWVVADLKDAFDNIPLNRLMDIVRKQFPGISDNVIELIKRVVGTDKKRGIRQGSPLSPFLMNIYLDHHLDGVWHKLAPDKPLLRTADDLLVCCRTQKRAQEALYAFQSEVARLR